MEFGSFERQAAANGDAWKASDAVNKPLIVTVTERREGIVTKFQPGGAPGIIADVADIQADAVYVGVLWMNGAIVDNLSPYLGQTVPVKLVYETAKNGTNTYITVEALKGAELDAAAKWGAVNGERFNQRRAELAAQAGVAAPEAPSPAPAAASPAAGAQTAAPAAQGADIAALIAQLQGAQ